MVAHVSGADKGDPAAQPHLPKGIKVGDLVKLKSLGRQARVERVIDAKNFEVSMGPMKMRAAIDDIAEVESGKVATPLEAARRRGNVTVSSSQNPDYVSSEINVIGRTADEAQTEVERYLDPSLFWLGCPGSVSSMGRVWGFCGGPCGSICGTILMCLRWRRPRRMRVARELRWWSCASKKGTPTPRGNPR